ncbi:PhnD/SsuA/transferrin family substrate-binding protein [Lacimicrobium sp. SS2-24]|uniref:PhnD/SsuA/transferrin family substrate-binding protein n=1 Tax=Lacimicrobium sp. SS2-24 TaxID=2005569 RepID=UPI0011312E25|nr:PhnD/SsuA/transferrin family substrate-binding protein [Lacimicrobium sp. SS2-24]
MTLSKTSLVFLALFLGSLLWIVVQHVHSSKMPSFMPLIQKNTECRTGNAENTASLILFITTESVARNLSQALCQNTVVGKQFGSVKAFWSHSEAQVLQFVGKGIADLALVKENLLEAVEGKSTYGYKMVAAYPDYSAYLIAMREKPALTKEYLLGKRLGLLDYPTSRSGHIIPIQLFKSLALPLDNMHITYANSHSELRQLLTSGRVDIISSFWQESDEAILSKNYITPIEQEVSGSKWYLKMDSNNIDLFCAVQQTLTDIARNQNSSYFSRLTTEPNCHVE